MSCHNKYRDSPNPKLKIKKKLIYSGKINKQEKILLRSTAYYRHK
jgi:hypothetical protein